MSKFIANLTPLSEQLADSVMVGAPYKHKGRTYYVLLTANVDDYRRAIGIIRPTPVIEPETDTDENDNGNPETEGAETGEENN